MLACSVAEGKCFLKCFLKAKCLRSLRKAEISGVWASHPCPLVLLHCCVASPAEPCPTGLRRDNGCSVSSFTVFCTPYAVGLIFYSLQSSEMLKIQLLTSFWLLCAVCCKCIALLQKQQLIYFLLIIAKYLSVCLLESLYRWGNQGWRTLPVACPHSECVLCSVYSKHGLPSLQLWFYVH